MNPQCVRHPHLSRIGALLSVLVFGFALVSIGHSRAPNQNPDSILTLTETADGFIGVFTFEQKQYRITNMDSKEEFATLISSPDSTPMVIAGMKDGVIHFATPSGLIKINTANPARFTEEEVSTIRTFVASNDTALIRRIIYEVRNRRLIEKTPHLRGFRVIAMLVGDGDVRVAATEKNANRAELTFKVSYKCPASSLTRVPKSPSCTEENCCGCCGPGCWGCTGCYTAECLAHDICVDEYGYSDSRCMEALVAAIASMSQCNM